MEKEKLNKKQIIPLVIGVLTMIILVSSATYAYFRVSIGNTATSTTITGDIGGGTLGTITLDGGGTNLYLGVSAYDMSESKKGTTYYSSSTEGSRETNVNNAGKTTYTATLSGDNSGETMYACDYEFTITGNGTIFESNNVKDLEVVFEGDINQTINFIDKVLVPYQQDQITKIQTVSGTFRRITSSNPTKEFNAYLQLTNTNNVQNNLAGTNLSVEIENTKWNCYLLDDSDLEGEAYAIATKYDEYSTDDYIVQNLTFLRSETPPTIGSMYKGEEIVAVYSGIEEQNYTYETSPYLHGRYDSEIGDYILYNNYTFEDEIRPISTAYLFTSSEMGLVTGVSNLDTSLVTNMEGMFRYGCFNCNETTELELQQYINEMATSNVTNMSYMFENVSEDLDLSGWDVSKVTNMSGMFVNSLSNIQSIENWDVSNVTNMSYMFSAFNGPTESLDLTNWDVSNVENMSHMFNAPRNNISLNLSGWNVSNVTNMEYMLESNLPNLSNWVISSKTNMRNFATGSSLSSSISTWDVSKMTNMSGMFSSVILHEDTDLSGWDVSNVTDMSYMFEFARLKADIRISNWDTGKVTNMSSMFDGVQINVDLDLSGWDVSNVNNYNYFSSVYGSGTLTPPNWPTT